MYGCTEGSNGLLVYQENLTKSVKPKTIYVMATPRKDPEQRRGKSVETIRQTPPRRRRHSPTLWETGETVKHNLPGQVQLLAPQPIRRALALLVLAHGAKRTGIVLSEVEGTLVCQRSSVVEQRFHKSEVTGSNPVAGTEKSVQRTDFLYLLHLKL